MPNASQSPKPKAPGAHNSNQKKQWGREGEQPARRRPGDGEGEELAMCYDWQILTRLNALFESAAPSASVSGASGKVLAVFWLNFHQVEGDGVILRLWAPSSLKGSLPTELGEYKALNQVDQPFLPPSAPKFAMTCLSMMLH